MFDPQTVFERNEKKYVLDDVQYTDILPMLEQMGFAVDQYGLHTICSLYLDNDRQDIARKALDKPVFREKLRLRSYGVPTSPNAAVFLELKKKLAGTTYKRRMALPYCEAERYLHTGVKPVLGGQVFEEIDWFMLQNHPRPSIVLCYDRIALADGAANGVRITFDSDVRWRDTDLRLADGDHGQQLLDKGQTLMEIKTPGAIPYPLAGVLSRLGIYPVSRSKSAGAWLAQDAPRAAGERTEMRAEEVLRCAG